MNDKTFSPEDSIRFTNVSFSYKKQKVFENFNFDLAMNQFVGIIGLNGSGKSTLLKLIMGLHSPQKGDIHILNRRAGDHILKHHIGSALQEIDFPPSILAKEILHFVSQQYSSSLDPNDLMKDFFVEDFKDKPCSELSGGMKRRLALACSFIGKPSIVLLDEPTTGLDLTSRLQLATNLKRYQKEHQALILMISHHPQEITEMVDQFIHIKKGEAIKVSPDKLSQMAQLKQIRFQCDETIDFSFAERVNHENNNYTIIAKDSDEVVRKLNKKTSDFKNLEIERLGTDQMIEGFL